MITATDELVRGSYKFLAPRARRLVAHFRCLDKYEDLLQEGVMEFTRWLREEYDPSKLVAHEPIDLYRASSSWTFQKMFSYLRNPLRSHKVHAKTVSLDALVIEPRNLKTYQDHSEALWGLPAGWDKYLKDSERKALVSYFCEDKTRYEVGREQGKSASWAFLEVSRALKKVRAALGLEVGDFLLKELKVKVPRRKEVGDNVKYGPKRGALILRLYHEGVPVGKIAERLGRNKASVNNYLRENLPPLFASAVGA